jgi:lipoyl(octanoyl) transferase
MVARDLGLREYEPVWREMRAFTDARGGRDPDQLWLVSHPPVFTFGQAGRPEHLHEAGGIPLVRSDRGGQVTYHGPGQALLYVLVDLRRAGLGVRHLVGHLEQAVIDVLADAGIAGERHSGAPGVYVGGAKVAALGLRVRNGCSYHGLALNVSMDLSPFTRIDPCGYVGLRVTQLSDLGLGWSVAAAGRRVGEALAGRLETRLSWETADMPRLLA